MRKERPFNGLDKVRVDYEFVNESSEDVAAEIAFPIPEYTFSYGDRWGDTFDDFKVSVGGVSVRPAREVRAFVGERDVTKDVQAAGPEVESLARVGQSLPAKELTVSFCRPSFGAGVQSTK